jgi:hypothetical protein
MDASLRKPGKKLSVPTFDKTEERRKQRQTCRLFFGYFLKAAQKKVIRLSGRKPDQNHHIRKTKHILSA